MKLFSAFDNAAILSAQDPVFLLQVRYVLVIVGLIELGVGTALCLLKDKVLRLYLVAWLFSGFLAYRSTLFLGNLQRPCGCLGIITGKLPFRQATLDHAALGLAMLMFVGSVVLLALNWMRCRANPKTGQLQK